MTKQITVTAGTHSPLGYLLYRPEPTPDAHRPPLVLFLHGRGERGNGHHDLERLQVNGIPRIVEEVENFGFITISPQCPSDSVWSDHIDDLYGLLSFAISTYGADPSRVYLTGISMGGFGTWTLASAHPELFAAVVPICGFGDVSMVCALKNTPVWVFHGKKDSVVPFEYSEALVNTLIGCGGNPRFTAYPDLDHDSWTVTYDNPELYSWLLEQRLPTQPG